MNKSIRLFISSTFSDMHRERELIHSYVQPAIKDYCLSRGYNFTLVDMRWGINDNLQKNHETMKVCLDEVRKCQEESSFPNFLILIGDRYGWEPAPVSIDASEFNILVNHLSTEDQRFVQSLYRLDENQVPATYIPEHSEDWYKHEPKLVELFRSVLPQVKKEIISSTKFLYSATHQEILLGFLNTDDQRNETKKSQPKLLLMI